ncbi:MAG TPA: GIY-YIG nuclease family protein [Patescibacteria group bacterium]|nr:GIY-YIG nuclease family protein [Patescibacteria group bacterium]
MKTNKELKEEYKLMKFPAGVFQIRNMVNGKIFINSSVNLDKVWNSQKFQLQLGSHPNRALQAEWKEFGESVFVFEILDEVTQDGDLAINLKEEVKALEDYFLEDLKPFGEKGYNIPPKNKRL